jgi:acetyl-CoA carboxylase biotin carboxylase subunit
VKALLATGYAGAGTVEFLLDGPDRWYFMEVNCRIQVEHPVTELVYGVDLVREQLLIAAGQPLGLKQSDLVPRGAAIECRINAEDPARDFLPTPGQLTTVRLPGGQFVRVDADAHCGGRVSPAYDPLLAKISVWGSDRPQAVARMLRALDEFHVEGPGVSTNRDFLRKAMRHPPFVAGTHNTSLVADLATATS